jgi:hypothetical protein
MVQTLIKKLFLLSSTQRSKFEEKRFILMIVKKCNQGKDFVIYLLQKEVLAEILITQRT